MDGSDSGTPNPLNPMSGNVENAGSTGNTGAPTSTMPEMSEAPVEAAPETAPAQAMPEFKEPAPRPAPANHGVIDPMMRSVAHRDNSTATTPNAAPTTTVEETFDSLTMDDDSLSTVTQSVATTTGPSRAEVVQTETIDTDLSGLSTPDLVAKDSIVEPAGKKGGKKKTLIISAVILLVVALICGVTAIAIILLNNNGDRVSKAIEKVISGEMPSIISAQGKVSIGTEVSGFAGTTSTSMTVDFSGTFDTASSMNKVSADILAEYSSGIKIPLSISEMSNKTGDTYFKISGLSNILSSYSDNTLKTSDADGESDEDESDTDTIDTADAVDATEFDDIYTVNCIDDTGCSGPTCTNKCIETESYVASPLETLSTFSGMLEAADNNWILISDDFAESVENLELFDNSSTCLINAFSTLPSYSKDIMNKYKANPFIKSSTDNLGIASKGDTLYKLSFDSEKLSAFSNSLGNNGFANELNACVGNTASNSGTSATKVEEIFDQFPELYAEIDNDNNFTRVYFQINNGDDVSSSTATADISLSYPKEFKLTEPTEYITMQELLGDVMTSLFNINTVTGEVSE